MQKKLLAVAVASALGAPAIGLAQTAATSTVQVFGTIYTEYLYYNNKDFSGPAGAPADSQDRVNFDYFRTSGSEIGFKGEEQLGGGLSAWFQCASTADIRGGAGASGWCSRNSALGLKGAFGNVYGGIWDTPFKRTYSIGNVGSGETGGFGNASVLLNGATAPVQGVGTLAGRGVWSRREVNIVNYDSPNFAGFQVLAAVQTANSATGITTGSNNDKSRTWSIGGQYSAGPLGLGLTYEKHQEVGPVAPGAGAFSLHNNLDDSAWAASGAYTLGPVKFGGVYSRQRSEVTTVLGTAAVGPSSGRQRVSTWHAGVDWTIIGAHGLRAGWTHAGNVRGDAMPAAVTPTTTSGYSPGVGARPNAGGSTGVNFYQIRYVYAFSKRTELNLGYSRINNKANAGYSYSDMTGNLAPGKDPSAWLMSLKHTF